MSNLCRSGFVVPLRRPCTSDIECGTRRPAAPSRASGIILEGLAASRLGECSCDLGGSAQSAEPGEEVRTEAYASARSAGTSTIGSTSQHDMHRRHKKTDLPAHGHSPKTRSRATVCSGHTAAITSLTKVNASKAGAAAKIALRDASRFSRVVQSVSHIDREKSW